MTLREMSVMTGAYGVALVAAAYFTRATAPRILGAMAGAAAAACVGLAMILLGEARGWWTLPHAPSWWFLPLLSFGLAVSLAPLYLVSWRVARRFGWRGLMVALGTVTLLGAPRDYLYAAKRPQWMVFSSGALPFLADAATYCALMVVGHAVMRWVAGPAPADRLARTRAAA
jgi:hypothetical protein